jgi:hypothetical protein
LVAHGLLPTTCSQAAADPKFAHTLRRLRLGNHTAGGTARTDSGNIDTGASTPAYDPAAAREALQRAAAAAQLSADQIRTITGVSMPGHLAWLPAHMPACVTDCQCNFACLLSVSRLGVGVSKHSLQASQRRRSADDACKCRTPAGERKQSLQRQQDIVADRRRTLAELQVRLCHSC